MKISKRQQKKNYKILEYLHHNNRLAYSEIVMDSKNKWRVFKLIGFGGLFRVTYHHWRIKTHYRKYPPKIWPPLIRTNYIIWPFIQRFNPTITRIIKECSKETIREDINFATLILLKVLCNNNLTRMKVKYYYDYM